MIILANGRIAEQGTPEVVRRSTDPLVHQFVNALADGPVQFHYPGVSVEDDFGDAEWGGVHDVVEAQTSGFRIAFGKLADIGRGARLFVRLIGIVGSSLQRFLAWCATRSTFWATTRWRSSACRACSSASCSGCRATTRCSATAPPTRWACWWR